MILEMGDYFMVMLKDELDNDLHFEGNGAESINLELISTDARGFYGRILKLEYIDESTDKQEVALVSLVERGEEEEVEGHKPYMMPMLLKPFDIIPVPKRMADIYRGSRKNYETSKLPILDLEDFLTEQGSEKTGGTQKDD